MAARIEIRAAQVDDAADWERLRQRLWPSAAGEHAGEIQDYFMGRHDNPAEVLLALTGGRCVGFAEFGIRPYAEDCYSGRVAFLEGIYVELSHRRHGIAAALIRAGEDWGRRQGCTELASDSEIGNTASTGVHEKAGFTEVNRIVCYRKPL